MEPGLSSSGVFENTDRDHPVDDERNIITAPTIKFVRANENRLTL